MLANWLLWWMLTWCRRLCIPMGLSRKSWPWWVGVGRAGWPTRQWGGARTPPSHRTELIAALAAVRAIVGWEDEGWKNAKRLPTANQDLWRPPVQPPRPDICLVCWIPAE